MIAVDTNILVYAHRPDGPFHRAALSAMTRLAESALPWAIPWPCLHEFYAVTTHPKVFRPPTPFREALAQVDVWLESPSLAVLSESSQHWPRLRALLETGQIRGPAVHDARIAAICAEHGVREFWTADRDFSRYPELKSVNPLVVAEESP